MKRENRFLITGAGGWLGRGLLNALTRGIPECPRLSTPFPDTSIKALVTPEEVDTLTGMFPNIDIVVGDLTKDEDCNKFLGGEEGSILFHLAGIIHPKWRVRDFFDVNTEGGKNLIRSAINNKIRRVVIMSSNSPVGCNPGPQHLFDEDSPFNPYMAYGKSKFLLELYVGSIKTEIETVVVRAPWFYGPFQPPRQLEFFEMIRHGKGPIIGGGENVRSMAYIDNLAQGLILAAITAAACGRTYWVADEHPYSMNMIINTIERLLATEFGQQCDYGRLRLPGFVSELALAADKSLQKVGLYHQKVHVLSEMNKNIACSISRAQLELGYCPSISLEEGMRRSLRDFYS